jgi:hypothetical protein
MFVNRFSKLFDRLPNQFQRAAERATVVAQPALPLVTLQELYQAAAERAYRDHELDKLFNIDYYSDRGAGI